MRALDAVSAARVPQTVGREVAVRGKDEFDRYVKVYKDTVFRVAYGYLRNHADADDVTQCVFVKLLRSRRSFESDEHARRWLIRVTVNECTTLYRTFRRRPENIDDYLDTLAAPDEEASDLLGQVMALPARYRVVLYLHYYEGYSTEEVAGMLGVPSSTVRTRLARGRKKLKDVLRGDEGL